MALEKVEYVNNQTVITAEQMNAIQDAIIKNEKNIPTVYITVSVDSASACTIDKTFAEIKAAYNAGRTLVCKYPIEDGIYFELPLLTFSETDSYATFILNDPEKQHTVVIVEVDGETQAMYEASTISRPNPNALTINGTSYDGSKPVNVTVDAAGAASSAVSTHNVSAAAHNDIRLLIEGLTTRLNALADSDDTTLDQMSEIVTYIKSNKTLIDSITTGKVSVSDIVNNLTTNVSNKPLSAAQGVALKALIDAIEVPEPLVGVSTEITPTQVATAIAAGRSVVISHIDATYGTLAFSGFSFIPSFHAVLASSIIYYASAYIVMELYGDTSDNDWTVLGTQLAQRTDIPTALKNPNALTFTGAATGSYDGSSAKTVNIPTVPTSLKNPYSLTVNGTVYDGSSAKTVNVATKKQGIYYIEGTGSTAGTWLGSHDDITEYYPGLTVLYKVPVAGASATTLNINSLGAVTVVRNATTAISTTCPVNSVVMLTYTVDSSTAYWKRSDYDANTKNSAGTSNKVGTKLFLVGGASQASSATTYSNTNCYIGTDNRLYSGGAVVPNTDEINSLIDTKLAAITNAEEVAF